MRAARKILVAIVALTALAGVVFLFVQHQRRQGAEPQTPLAPAQEYVTIYLVQAEPTEFHLVPVERKIGGPASPEAALQALLNGPLEQEELYSSVPITAKLRSLTVQEGLATADFSAHLVEDFNGGALLESYLVAAIVNTLTEFPHIDQVQILVEGQVVESIGGHILVNRPLRRGD